VISIPDPVRVPLKIDFHPDLSRSHFGLPILSADQANVGSDDGYAGTQYGDTLLSAGPRKEIRNTPWKSTGC